MLDKVRIQNFRCLRDVTLDLGAFTVFVGPNASGKTAIADALTFPVKSRPSQLEWWRRGGSEATWNGNIQSDGLGPGRVAYGFKPSTVRDRQTANEAYALTEGAQNLANLFDTLPRAQQEAFVGEFTRLVPMYADITARARQGKAHLQFQDRWAKDVWYTPEQVSDGTLLTAAFVALSFQRDVPDLAVFEDPDHALHPYLQLHVVDLLRKLSRGEIGPKAIQIVCTTHSKAFLDFLEPDEVRFLERDRMTGETKVHAAPTDSPRWKDVYDKYQGSLGDMWMTGTLGGVPGV